MMDKHGINDIESFDNIFGGTQSIYNWSMDYDMELENAIVENLEFAQTRIDFCTEYIERYKDKNEHNIKEMMRKVAGTYFQTGNTDIAEELLSKYLKDDPRWGWGWIEWSDQYYLYEYNGIKDTDKAIRILKQGLDVKGLNDRGDVLDRLHDIYIDMDMRDEAEEVMQEMTRIRSKKQATQSNVFITEDSDKNIPYVAGNKIGRNSPCPCGSGKKYKNAVGNRINLQLHTIKEHISH
jgi:tetratricopeptide (TPR) repeat protein